MTPELRLTCAQWRTLYIEDDRIPRAAAAALVACDRRHPAFPSDEQSHAYEEADHG